jgi:hypothetical protein
MMKPNFSTGLFPPTQRKGVLRVRDLPLLIGRTSRNLSPEEMMHNVSTSGIKVTNHQLQRLNGKKEKMMNYSRSSQRRGPSNGKKSQRF